MIEFLLCLLRLEPGSILFRENETENHVTEVARIRIQRIHPVCKPDSVRVASQVTEILHRHETAVEELIEYRRVLDDVSQHLGTCLCSAIQRIHEVGFI